MTQDDDRRSDETLCRYCFNGSFDTADLVS